VENVLELAEFLPFKHVLAQFVDLFAAHEFLGLLLSHLDAFTAIHLDEFLPAVEVLADVHVGEVAVQVVVVDFGVEQFLARHFVYVVLARGLDFLLLAVHVQPLEEAWVLALQQHLALVHTRFEGLLVREEIVVDLGLLLLPLDCVLIELFVSVERRVFFPTDLAVDFLLSALHDDFRRFVDFGFKGVWFKGTVVLDVLQFLGVDEPVEGLLRFGFEQTGVALFGERQVGSELALLQLRLELFVLLLLDVELAYFDAAFP